MTESPAVNCAEACTKGCIQPDHCPNRVYQTQASDFIQKTSLEDLLAMAEAAAQRRNLERIRQQESPQWVIPDDI